MKATGVYAIRCTANGKVYVGSAAVSFEERWKSHRNSLRGRCHHNRYLQRAWLKQGEAAFEFVVLEECDPTQCIEREQFWIDSKRAAVRPYGYNLSPTAGSLLGYKHSDEAKAKSAAVKRGKTHTAETRAKLAAHFRGKPLSESHKEAISKGAAGKPKSEEHRKRVSEAKTGKKRPPFSEEWRKAMSNAHKGKPKSEEHRRKIAEGNRRHNAAKREQLLSG